MAGGKPQVLTKKNTETVITAPGRYGALSGTGEVSGNGWVAVS